MKKKIKDLTIGEIFEMCTNSISCANCPFEYHQYRDNIPERNMRVTVCLRLIDIFHLNILNKEVLENE